MEALTIIKAQRQYQKNQLIHQVVSQASTVDLHLYPRYVFLSCDILIVLSHGY